MQELPKVLCEHKTPIKSFVYGMHFLKAFEDWKTSSRTKLKTDLRTFLNTTYSRDKRPLQFLPQAKVLLKIPSRDWKHSQHFTLRFWGLFTGSRFPEDPFKISHRPKTFSGTSMNRRPFHDLPCTEDHFMIFYGSKTVFLTRFTPNRNLLNVLCRLSFPRPSSNIRYFQGLLCPKVLPNVFYRSSES